MIEILKEYEPGDDFVVLRVICPPLKEKRVSVSVAGLAEGSVTIEGEMEREREDAQRRLDMHNKVQEML